MTVKERLAMYLECRGISNRKFSLSIGMSESYVANIRTSIQPGPLARIAELYPDLNTDWLMTGNGDMLNDESIDEKGKVKEFIAFHRIPESLFYSTTGLPEGYLDEGRKLGLHEARAILNAFPELNVDWLMLDRGPMTTDHTKRENGIDSIETNPENEEEMMNAMLVRMLYNAQQELAQSKQRVAELEDVIDSMQGRTEKKENLAG